MTAQSVILPLPSDHARFIILRLKDLTIDELKEKLADLFTTRDRLITQHPNAQIKTGVAFGPELWAKLYHQTPAGFKQLEPIQGSFQMPVVPADVLIHIASARADICFALSQSFLKGFKIKLKCWMNAYVSVISMGVTLQALSMVLKIRNSRMTVLKLPYWVKMLAFLLMALLSLRSVMHITWKNGKN